MDDSYLKFLFQEDLYLVDKATKNKDSTVEKSKTDTSEKVEISTPEIETKSEGNAAAPVCIINKSSGNEIISDQNRAFLEKVLAAVNLNLSEIYLVQFDSESLEHILEAGHAKTVLTFGCKKDSLYSINEHKEKRVLHAQDLNQISVDTTAKRNLWNALKELFQ